jgi:hypothetical protein
VRFVPGDPVTLREDRVSNAGGEKRTFAAKSKGRVCKVHGSGFCCVKFAKRCLRVHEDFLEDASEPAPECSSACSGGC